MNKKNVLSNIVLGMVTNKKELNIPWTKIFLTTALLATIIGALISTKTLIVINKNIAATKEAARPANVKIIKITAPNCKDCFNINDAVSGFKKLNIKAEEEKTLTFDSPEGRASIIKFAIKKVPTYLVTGEITKNNLENFIKSNGKIKDKTFIFTKVTPIFIDTATGQETGHVTATLITDLSCPQCIDLKPLVENFKKAGVKITDLKELAWNSQDAQNIINQYKITKIPTFIFSPEFDLYDAKSGWPNFGTIEQDKTYVARNLPLPYRDLAKGQIVGFVDLIFLTDSSCTDCYKVQDVQKPILTKGYGVALRSERTVDVESLEGQSLITKYNITKVPTIILSPGIDQYSNIKNVWKSVGIVGSDGWYVFTGLNLLGNITYKDLTSNQVIKPAQPSTTPTK